MWSVRIPVLLCPSWDRDGDLAFTIGSALQGPALDCKPCNLLNSALKCPISVCFQAIIIYSAETNKISCEYLENSSALLSCEVKTVTSWPHRDFSWSEAHVLFHAELLPPQGELLTERSPRRGCLDPRECCGYLVRLCRGSKTAWVKGVWEKGMCWGRAALPPCHVHRVAALIFIVFWYVYII